MTLVNVRPSNRRKVRTFGNLFDEFFHNGLADFVGTDGHYSRPSVNVLESKDGFKIELAAPGLSKEDFKINIEKNVLTISASHEHQEESTDNKYKRREFNYAAFKRSFNLPEIVDKDAIAAAYENGVLNVTLPKVEAAKNEPKEIVIA
ncbi:MAG: Hsp20/alpha crystallin family protein [Bacteroidota bacterium]